MGDEIYRRVKKAIKKPNDKLHREYLASILRSLNPSSQADVAPDIWEEALYALYRLATREPSTKEYVKGIFAGLLNDKDKAIYAVKRLGMLGAKEHIKDIAKLLNGESIDVKISSAEALGELSAKKYAKDIAKLLKDENGAVRSSAVSALEKLNAKEYAIEIAALLEDRSFLVRKAALKALDKFKAKEYAKNIAELLRKEMAGTMWRKGERVYPSVWITSLAERILKKWGLFGKELK